MRIRREFDFYRPGAVSRRSSTWLAFPSFHERDDSQIRTSSPSLTCCIRFYGWQHLPQWLLGPMEASGTNRKDVRNLPMAPIASAK